MNWNSGIVKIIMKHIFSYVTYSIINYFYYFVIFADFFFRLVWIFTLSPSIANQALGSPQIFSLVTGMAEIIRRGIWNMLRV